MLGSTCSSMETLIAVDSFSESPTRIVCLARCLDADSAQMQKVGATVLLLRCKEEQQTYKVRTSAC